MQDYCRLHRVRDERTEALKWKENRAALDSTVIRNGAVRLSSNRPPEKAIELRLFDKTASVTDEDIAHLNHRTANTMCRQRELAEMFLSQKPTER